MNRRGFLGSMLAAASAPAIVRAENLMKIVVPPEKKIIIARGLTRTIQTIDEFGWLTPVPDRDYYNIWVGDFDISSTYLPPIKKLDLSNFRLPNIPR